MEYQPDQKFTSHPLGTRPIRKDKNLQLNKINASMDVQLHIRCKKSLS